MATIVPFPPFLPQLTAVVGRGYFATSSTSFAIDFSQKSINTQSGLAYVAGSRVRITSSSAPSDWVEGIIVSYAGTAMTVDIDAINGSAGATHSDWSISIAGQPGQKTEFVVVASITPAALTGLFTESGVPLTAGMPVGRFGQTDPIDNGTYIAASGAWARSPTFNSPINVQRGSRVLVLSGNNGLSGSEWYVTTATPDPGATALNFDRVIKDAALKGTSNTFTASNTFAAPNTFTASNTFTATGTFTQQQVFSGTAVITAPVNGIPLTISGVSGSPTVTLFQNADGVTPAYLTLRDNYSGTRGGTGIPGDGNGGVIAFQSKDSLGVVQDAAFLNAGLIAATSTNKKTDWDFNGFVDNAFVAMFAIDGSTKALTPGGTGIWSIGTGTRYFKDGFFSGNIQAGGLFSTSMSASFVTVSNTLSLTSGLMVNVAPTIASGFGTSPAITFANGTATCRLQVGTGGTAQTGALTLPAATNGWNAIVTNLTTKSTTVFSTQQTASTTTSVTLGNFNNAGAAAPWVAGDVLAIFLLAF